MAYYLAASLRKLTNEVNARMAPPNWPTVSVGDGWVGDTSHSARKSDHNPDYSSGGVVRAVDIGISGRNAAEILKEAIGDPRVWYVIHKGHIWSRTYGWRKRRYTGSNPHNHHIHISIRSTRAAETDTRPWFGTKKPKRVKPGPVNLKNVRKQALISLGVKKGARKDLYGIKRIQYALHHHVDKSLVVDGWWGPATTAAWRKFERAHTGTGRPGVPDLKSLRALDKLAWAVKGIDRSK